MPVACARSHPLAERPQLRLRDLRRETFVEFPANAKNVVFYLEDGGACFSAETCAPNSGVYQTGVGRGPVLEGGIFDLGDTRNPFADYSVVYVPYCTGDVHIGNTTTEYARGLTVQHKGYVNGSAALDYLTATFPDAANVAVIGESAGAIAAPLYAALVSDRLPSARITSISDGSGAFPDVPQIDEIIAAWTTGSAGPAWPENFGHDPDIVFARYDYADDEHQAGWSARIGIPEADVLSRINANENRIEGAGVNLITYIAPGSSHTVLSEETFYTEEVNGQSLVHWVAGLVEGKPVGDVRCQKCRLG